MTQRFHILDFYRFMAASLVMAFHVIPNFNRNFGAFNLFVDFFFMLSGFVIFKSYQHKLGTWREYCVFLWARIARIYPLHLLTMLMFIAMVLFVIWSKAAVTNNDKYVINGVWQNLLLVHSWGATNSLDLNAPSWSISAEWLMYLLSPLIFYIAKHWNKHLLLLLALICIGFLQLNFIEWTENTFDYGALRALPGFLIGVYLANMNEKSPFAFPHLSLGIFIFCLSMVMIYLQMPRLLILFVFALALYVTACGEARGEKSLLHHPFCVTLGDASYAIYMLHYVLFISLNFALKKYIPEHILPYFIMVFIVVASVYTYRYFEKPAQNYLRGFYK